MPLEKLINEIRGSRRTLWILCGLPYSGKTYVSDEIVKQTPVVYVSIDRILEEMGFDWDSGHLPDENGWKKVFNLSYKRSKEALGNDRNVLYDSTNHTKVSRDTLRETAQEAGAETRVIFVDTPIKVVWRRWEESSLKKNRSVVAKELVEATIQSFEHPTDDEGFFVVQNNSNY